MSKIKQISNIRRRTGLWRAFWWAFLTMLLMVPVLTVYASVDLVSFEAAGEGARIRIDWHTATELDNAGFFIRRGLSESGDPSTDFVAIPVEDADDGTIYQNFIPARGDGLSDEFYAVYDDDIADNVVYWYYLESVDVSNQSEFHGPVSASISGGTPTATPTVSPTPESETATPTATVPTVSGTPPTATSTSTPAPTQTGTPPTATNTALPTSTQTPTITATQPSPTPSESATPTATRTVVVPTGTETPALVIQNTEESAAPVLESPTPSSTPTETEIPEETLLEGVDEGAFQRVLTAGSIILLGGLLLTAGFIFYVRRNRK